MIRGIYSAATALDAAAARQEVTAENLAHLATPGYRARGVVFESFEKELNGAMGGSKVGATFVDFQPGPMRSTGATYHLAIEGDSFFGLEGPNGTAYTRNGSFKVDGGGRIVSEGGYPLLGQAGPITVPPEAARVTIARDGNVSADGVPVGQIQLTRFANVQKLQPVGPTLFAAKANAGEEPGQSGVMQGFLEGSNVTPASAMVELIQTSRSFEAAQRALRALSDVLQLDTRPEA